MRIAVVVVAFFLSWSSYTLLLSLLIERAGGAGLGDKNGECAD
jgi:hypothetical protein